jgi:hypothetical protein
MSVGGAIEPLDLIDEADQRMLLRRVGEQAEDGQPEQDSIRVRTRAQTERDRHGVELRRWQPCATVEQSRAQPMNAGKRQLHLPFRPERARDPAPPARCAAYSSRGGVPMRGSPGAPAPRCARAAPLPATDRASHTRSHGRPNTACADRSGGDPHRAASILRASPVEAVRRHCVRRRPPTRAQRSGR